jgi:transcriptional regulator with XRE-family HTH domain
MDELNKRVLSVMESKQLSKSTFATLLEISLPVLTHISSGRNKPGLELIQKLLTKFPDLNPDWLLLGKGQPQRVEAQKPDFSAITAELESIKTLLNIIEERTEQVLSYHKIVHREISYLNDLDQLLYENQSLTLSLKEKLSDIRFQIESKLK